MEFFHKLLHLFKNLGDDAAWQSMIAFIGQPTLYGLMFAIMTPVEILGKFAKPFALAVRLFANMTAGHIVVLALIGLIFTFQSWAVAGGPFIMAVLIMMLELFVALLQAYIFTLLSSVFIGLIREGAH
jgi:F-type H+-transporting ATPase subunit a